ncbi:MAG TPA: phosphoglycolate phosphatase, partial [Burkholderiaceae bacterium]|nr:phosphoglycolate phosphatase [Burkholderiaceae bacterium]
IPASRCVLIEDTLSHLKVAKALGLRTVWVTGYLPGRPPRLRLPCAPYVDVKIKSVRQLSGNLHRLR